MATRWREDEEKRGGDDAKGAMKKEGEFGEGRYHGALVFCTEFPPLSPFPFPITQCRFLEPVRSDALE